MKIRRLSAALAGVTVLAAAGCGGDDREAAGASAALAVATDVLVAEDGYTALVRYAGRVEAGRRSQLGFELGGEIAAIAVDEGDRVEAGDVLARLDTARLRAQRAEAVAAVAAASADAELAAATLARVREARSYDGVSPLELDQAEQRAAAADAAQAAAAAVVERIDVELGKSTLRAPYAGTVVARSVDEGQIVAQGRAVIDLQESAAREVRIGLGGEVPDGLEPGAARTLSINGGPVEARVRAIVPARDSATRTLDVIFDLDEAAVLPGDIARLAVERRVDAAGFWVPLDALAEGRRGLWSLYVATPMPRDTASLRGATHRIEPRPVEVLHQDDGQVFATGTASAGELVVLGGLQRVVPGQEVRLTGVGSDSDVASGRSEGSTR